MEYSANGLLLTEKHEGFRDKAYRDSGGIWTCGFGHTEGVSPSTVCTEELATEWLKKDVQNCVNAITNLVEVDLTQDEFDALVDFSFNVGIHAFANSTMLILLNQGDYISAAGQFDRWDLCKGKVIAGLLNRRMDETSLFDCPEKGI